MNTDIRTSAVPSELTIAVSGRALATALLLAAGGPALAQTDPATTPTANPTAGATTTGQQAVEQPGAAVEGATAAPETQGDEIVVTGFRASLESSARVKRASTLIVDSVSAEDVGKLPDVSIADSLARLPGVTAQRLEGRDQRLSIRGLGPDFGTTLLNGREQVTVGDNRGVEYDQYPSEFFKRVDVYKSADASLIAAGISGTVDLRMLRPLDQGQRVFVVAGRAQMNSIKSLNPDGDRYGYRATATYVDQFADDTLGIAIGVSATEAPSQDERYNAWGYAGSGTAASPFRLGGAKPYVQSNTLKRYGGVATVEWQPSDSFHSTFDALYTDFEELQRLRGIEFPLAFDGRTTATSEVITDGFSTSATVSPPFAVQRNDLNRRKAKNLSLGWNNQFAFSDTLKLNVDASWSRAKRTDFLLETYTGTGYNASGVRDTLSITQNKNGTFDIVPTLNYADAGLFRITDPGGWGFNGTTTVVQAGFLNRPDFKDDLKSLRANLNGEFENSVVKGWEVGANYSRRKKTSAYTSFFLCPRGGGTNCTVASGTPTSVPVPAEALLKKNVSLSYLGVPQMLTLDPLYLYENTLNPVFDNRPGSLVRDNVVAEKVYTGYAKLIIDGTVGGKALKGSIGAQVVHTKQSSTGTISNFQVVNGLGVVTVLPAAGGISYTDVLPSATMSVELLPATFVKLGASRTLVRPQLDQERVNQEFTITPANIGNPSALGSPFSSTGGNAALRPYYSNNVDFSFEKYFEGGGYFSLAGYYKDLHKFIDPSRSVAFDFSAAVDQLPPDLRAIVVAQNLTTGLSRSPDNSGRGNILGAEATLSLPFRAVLNALDGFGLFSSVSYNKSEIKYASNPGQTITIPGLSKWVGSASLFYEKAGFQARASYRYRSSFLGEVAGLSANPEFRSAKAEGILDAQIGYEFQEGALKGLAILAQGKNLTDRPFVTYDTGDPRRVRDYQRYGREYYLGVTYKF